MNKPVRILQVFSRMDRGGAETMIITYYKNIDRDKVQFDFIVHTEDKCAFDEEINSLGGQIYRMPRYNIVNHFKYISLWKKFFIAHPELKIIHGHYFTFSAIYFYVAKKFNITCIAHSHIAFKNTGFSSLLLKLVTYPIRFFTDYYFACSKLAGEWMYGNKINLENKIVIHKNAIDADKFKYNEQIRQKLRSEYNLEHKMVLGHIGRFNKQKNHDFLIDVFREVLKKNSEAVLLLIGDGELKPVIQKKVEMLKLREKVIFTGVRNDIPALLNAMDIFVFPSLYEGLGIVLIEAQTSGLKSFTSDKVVPQDANITDLLEYIPLKKPADYWAKRILDFKNGYKRVDRYKEIVDSGYDIHSSAIWLENFYLQAFNENAEKVI